LKALSKPTKQCERLGRCVKQGIAFHHAGLVAKQRELIEDNFRNGSIKIICATPTLSFGLDLPAFRAILKDLRRYGPRGMAHIPVLEYLQMSGRAGRPKFDKVGESICVAVSENEKKKLYEKYVLGEPEEINSKLAVEPVLRTYLLSLIAANFVDSRKEIIDFFGKTFWAFQFMDMERLVYIIDKMLSLLEEWEFIDMKKEDFSDADKLNDGKVKATIMGKRVAELYIDPLTANFFISCLKKGAKQKVNSFSFLQMISHTLEIRPLLRAGVKDQEWLQEKIVKFESFLLEKEPSIYSPEYEEYVHSIKTASMFHEWTNEKDEEFLLENFNARPGEIRAKMSIGDWLLYANSEISRILNFNDLNKEIVKLRFRLKHGVKEELLSLIKIKGIGRVRARKLFFNRIKDIKDVKNAELGKLIQILGKQVALSVKKQVGQEVKEVPKGKRKGQVSLGKYD
jgi:helicase